MNAQLQLKFDGKTSERRERDLDQPEEKFLSVYLHKTESKCGVAGGKSLSTECPARSREAACLTRAVHRHCLNAPTLGAQHCQKCEEELLMPSVWYLRRTQFPAAQELSNPRKPGSFRLSPVGFSELLLPQSPSLQPPKLSALLTASEDRECPAAFGGSHLLQELYFLYIF